MTKVDFYPHLSPKWVNEATLGLRSRGANGATIGDVLAVAEAHCADSGETAEEAFGPALKFAADYPISPTEEKGRLLSAQIRDAWPSLLGLVGMFLAFACVDDWGQARGIGIRAGVVLATAMILVASVLLVARPALTLARPYVGGLLLMVTFIGVVLLQATLREPLFYLPHIFAVGLSVLLLAGSVIASYRQGPSDDPVTDPVRGNPWPGTSRLVSAITPWLFVIMTAIAVVFFAVLPGR